MTARALLEVANEIRHAVANGAFDEAGVAMFAATQEWAANIIENILAAASLERAVGFQYRHRADTTNPPSDWSDPEGMRNVDHYLTRPQTFDIRYVYAREAIASSLEGHADVVENGEGLFHLDDLAAVCQQEGFSDRDYERLSYALEVTRTAQSKDKPA